MAAQCLAPAGRLLFNAFLPRHGYVPDGAARELGQQIYTATITEDALAAAAADLPLEQVGNDSVHEYEKTHLPADGWPSTGWYPEWISDLDLFGVPPRASNGQAAHRLTAAVTRFHKPRPSNHAITLITTAASAHPSSRSIT